jgi:hypothetical protein
MSERPVTLAFEHWGMAVRSAAKLLRDAHEQNDIVGAMRATLVFSHLAKTHGVPRGFRRAIQKYYQEPPRPEGEMPTLRDDLPALERLCQGLDRAWLAWRDKECAEQP